MPAEIALYPRDSVSRDIKITVTSNNGFILTGSVRKKDNQNGFPWEDITYSYANFQDLINGLKLLVSKISNKKAVKDMMSEEG